MLKIVVVKNSKIEDLLYPNFYKFKTKIKEFIVRKDITSFNLGEVLLELTDGEHAGQVFVDSGAKFIKNSAVKRYLISECDGFFITHEKNDLLTRSQLKLHDVLFTTIGNIGISAVVNRNLVGANINQNVVRMRVNDSLVSPQYLSLFLNSKIARYQINTLFTGNIHPILTYPKIKSLKIFIKEKSVHDIITRNIVLAETYAMAGLQKIHKAKEIFVKSLDINFSEIADNLCYSIKHSDIKLNDIMTPEYYRPLYINTIKKIKLKYPYEFLGEIVTDFKSGHEVGSENYKLYLDRNDNDVPFIRTTDILNYEIDRYPDFYIENDFFESLKQDINPNEFLYSKDGNIGLVAMTTKSDRCILGSGILRIIANTDKINPYYLFTALSVEQIGLYQAKQRTVIASTLPHLRADRISDFIIPMLPNQNEIINLVKQGFDLKEKSKELIDISRKLLDNSLEI